MEGSGNSFLIQAKNSEVIYGISTEMHLIGVPHCLSEKGAQEPFESIFVFLVTSTLLDRGWSMKLSSTVFFLLSLSH